MLYDVICINEYTYTVYIYIHIYIMCVCMCIYYVMDIVPSKTNRTVFPRLKFKNGFPTVSRFPRPFRYLFGAHFFDLANPPIVE